MKLRNFYKIDHTKKPIPGSNVRRKSKPKPLSQWKEIIPLWIAQYRNTLTLPKGWKSCFLWQYTDKGRIKGISTYVDLNKTV